MLSEDAYARLYEGKRPAVTTRIDYEPFMGECRRPGGWHQGIENVWHKRYKVGSIDVHLSANKSGVGKWECRAELQQVNLDKPNDLWEKTVKGYSSRVRAACWALNGAVHAYFSEAK